MAEFSIRLDPATTLRIGNNLSAPNSAQSHGFIGLLLEHLPVDRWNDPTAQPDVTQLATLKPSEARALGSMLLTCVTDAKV